MIRRERLTGRLDRTEAAQAIDDLNAWPGERFGHRLLLTGPGSCGTRPRL